jgi:hypothetical protein
MTQPNPPPPVKTAADTLSRKPAASKFGAAVFVLLGIALALYAAVPRTFYDHFDHLFFPIEWLCCVTAALATFAFLVLMTPLRQFQSIKSASKFTASGFFMGYTLIFVCGFDWTGDWMRFLIFRLGLRDEQSIQIAGSSDWKVYYW